MARRGRGAEDLDGDRPIELIDPIPPIRPTSEFETPDDDRPRPGREPAASHSRLVGLAAALVAAVAVWTLAGSRNDAPSPPTTEPVPVEEPEPGIAAPRIGAGPELRWERIMWNIGTNDFRWIDGSFVGDDGTTEWSVTPSIIGPTIRQRPSVLTDHPDYFIVDAVGARVLAPRVPQPDHLLVLTDDDAGVRIELPAQPSVTDLVVRSHRIEAAVIDTTAVVAVHQTDQIDTAALAERLGLAPDDVLGVRVFNDRLSVLTPGPPGSPPAANDVGFADGPFTATERSAMGGIGDKVDLYTIDLTLAAATPVPSLSDTPFWTNRSTGPAGIVPDAVESLGVAGDRFVLEWYTSNAPAFVSTSTTGRSWSPPRDFSGIGRIDGGGGAIYGVLLTTDLIGRSVDGGSTWDLTPSPLREFELSATREHLVLTERVPAAPTLTYEIEIDGHVLTITEDSLDLDPEGPTFVLSDIGSGSVTSGTIGATGSGATYDPYDGSLDIVVGDEPTSIDASTLWLAASHAAGPPEPSPEIASARWVGTDAPEWTLDTLTELFGDTAVRVDFVGGDAEMLAVATTTSGYRVYMAELPTD